jgi:hypothetical protein
VRVGRIIRVLVCALFALLRLHPPLTICALLDEWVTLEGISSGDDEGNYASVMKWITFFAVMDRYGYVSSIMVVNMHYVCFLPITRMFRRSSMTGELCENICDWCVYITHPWRGRPQPKFGQMSLLSSSTCMVVLYRASAHNIIPATFLLSTITHINRQRIYLLATAVRIPYWTYNASYKLLANKL